MIITITTATPKVLDVPTITGTTMADANRALRVSRDSSTTRDRLVAGAERAGEVPLPFLGGWPGRGADGDLSVAGPEAVSGLALQRLLAWLSPSFPVGAYSYSHGLEWAVEDGSVTDAATLAAWIGDILHHGSGRSDGILFAHAYRAVGNDDPAALRELVELAAAFQPSKERHLEATAQGQAFLTMIGAAWPSPILTRLLAEIPTDPPVTYAIAVAVATAAHGVPLAPALAGYLAAFVANLVSAGVRAIPIGQTDGQRIIAATAPLIGAIAGTALAAGLDQLGGAAFRADIASMKHETQYSRLFRS